ncbi:ABC transporter permease [bacterium 1XD21-13]|nr:ABC transporter permease [bacterium 1XD21-13]
MLKLIKLEWKKNRIGKYMRNAVLLALFLCVFVFALAFLGIANDPESGVPDAALETGMLFSSIEMLTSISFLVFTGVMLSSFIVGAYQNKTMNLMFSYPMKRQKILISQMLAVWIFNFGALVVTKLMIYGCVLVGSCFMTAAFPIDFDMVSVEFYVQVLVKSGMVVTMEFIALFVGLKMKSSKAVIVFSFLLIVLTQANVGDFTLRDQVVFPVVLMGVSLVFAFLSVMGVEKRDLM